MIYDGTQGVQAADPVARVPTLVPDASPVSWTIGIQDALRSASQIRISLILGQAGARIVKASRVRPAICAWVRGYDYRI